jgi:hypothetical protein
VAAGARPRRIWIVLGVLALLALAGWWVVQRQLEPERLTATVLTRLGDSLKLDITFEGTPEYAFKPEPRLRVPNIVVTDPATGKVVLRAKRLEASLPWSTIRGGDIVITRLELDEPVLDADALQRWLAARPEAPFKLPTFTNGLEVANGKVVGLGWSLEGLQLVLPRLATGEPVDLQYRLRLLRGGIDARMQGRLELAAASAASTYSLQGNAKLERKPEPLAADIDSRGRYRIGDDTFALQADVFSIEGESPLPTLVGEGWIDKRGQFALGYRGALAAWPAEWPALPAPVGAAEGPYPLVLLYRGRGDFSDPLRMALTVGEAHMDAQARVPELLAWIDAPTASPLPPVTGTLTVPQIDMEGIVLRGVRAVLEDDDVPPPAETDAPAPASSP